jgi:hypothetical protein
VTGSCKYVYDPSLSTKGGEYLDQLSDYQQLKKDFVHAVSYECMRHDKKLICCLADSCSLGVTFYEIVRKMISNTFH